MIASQTPALIRLTHLTGDAPSTETDFAPEDNSARDKSTGASTATSVFAILVPQPSGDSFHDAAYTHEIAP